MQHATDLLCGLPDSRLLIENMPKMGIGGEAMIGYSPEQIEELIRDSDMELCLDGHAVKAAVGLGVDYKEYVKGFMGLEPKVFHVSDGRLGDERDEHLGIRESGSELVTVETPRARESLNVDIENLYTLKKIIGSI
jgi:deoxyribonuclease-4